MELYIAKHGGFCFGVKRAVETAIATTEAHDARRPIYTYGPIIHNQDVVKMLAERGAQVIDTLDDIHDCTVIVRSHGVGEAFYKEAEEKHLDVIDTTCVFVKKVHRLVKESAEKGERIIICGDPDHPEVKGICGWAADKIHVVDSVENCEKLVTMLLAYRDPLCIVAQTTLNTKLWEALTEQFKKLPLQIHIHNTICSATRLRQDEVHDIAQKVDFILVIGGKESSNTQKLFEIAKKYQKKAQHIENVDEINVNFLKKYDKIGIVAGASTPDWVIQEVIQKLKSEGEVVVNGRQ